MGESCCQSKARELARLRQQQTRVLWVVLVLNALMFVVEFSAGFQSGSSSLTGDSLDMLGDSLVFAKAIYHLLIATVPQAEIMSGIGIMALLVNLLCLALLTRHRKDNLNMTSVWLCSRNDIIANSSVLAAAGLVLLTHSLWPDLIVGLLLTGVFLSSARHVLLQSWREIHQG